MDLEATESERKQLEYSTQFFEFTPDAFVDSISAPTVDMVSELLDVRKDFVYLIECYIDYLAIF